MIRPIATLAALLIAAPASAITATDEPNFCHSLAAKNQWRQALATHSENEGIATLYALREGFCSMVDEGHLSVDKATVLFEKQRSRIVGEMESGEY